MIDKAENIWKWIASGLAGLLIGGIPWLYTISRDLVDRATVIEIMEKRAPYLQDRKVIMEWVSRSKESDKNFTLKLDNLNENFIRLDAGMRQLTSVLQELKNRLGK